MRSRLRWAFQSSQPPTDGPDLPFSPWLIAAVQLHHTGHSSIAQHFQVASDGNADKDEAAHAAGALVAGVEQ